MKNYETVVTSVRFRKRKIKGGPQSDNFCLLKRYK